MSRDRRIDQNYVDPVVERVKVVQAYLDRWAIHWLSLTVKGRPASRDLCRELRQVAIRRCQAEGLDLDGVEILAHPHRTIYGAIDVRAVAKALIPLYEEPPIE